MERLFDLQPPSRWTPLLIATIIMCMLHQCLAELQEYCKWQTFNPRCASDEIVVMKEAFYGRMQGCIERDYGYVGCKSDVLTLADTMCSGRRECNLKIPVERFAVNSSCPKDLSHHLMADFTCQKVITPNRTYCYSHKTATLPAVSSWIASKTTEEFGCGSTETPWILRTDPGQTINFTLHDFALKSALLYNDSSRSQAMSANCHVYIIFKERSGRPKTVCGGTIRSSHVYTTLTNEVEIRIMMQVHGCPDPARPVGGWIERRGDDVTVGCNEDDVTWHLKCVGNKWTGSKIKNCSKVAGSTGESTFRGISFSHSLSIVVILAVAMVIGVLILAIGLLCLKRRRQRATPPQQQAFGPYSSTAYKEGLNYKTSTTCTAYSHPSFMSRADTSGENDYEYVDDIKYPPPPPQVAGSTFGKTCTAHGGGSAFNQYGFDGTPNFAKMKAAHPNAIHVHQIGLTGPSVPQYYEIDPAKETEKKESIVGVQRPLSEENTSPARQNINFGHYSQ